MPWLAARIVGLVTVYCSQTASLSDPHAVACLVFQVSLINLIV